MLDSVSKPGALTTRRWPSSKWVLGPVLGTTFIVLMVTSQVIASFAAHGYMRDPAGYPVKQVEAISDFVRIAGIAIVTVTPLLVRPMSEYSRRTTLPLFVIAGTLASTLTLWGYFIYASSDPGRSYGTGFVWDSVLVLYALGWIKLRQGWRPAMLCVAIIPPIEFGAKVVWDRAVLESTNVATYWIVVAPAYWMVFVILPVAASVLIGRGIGSLVGTSHGHS